MLTSSWNDTHWVRDSCNLYGRCFWFDLKRRSGIIWGWLGDVFEKGEDSGNGYFDDGYFDDGYFGWHERILNDTNAIDMIEEELDSLENIERIDGQLAGDEEEEELVSDRKIKIREQYLSLIVWTTKEEETRKSRVLLTQRFFSQINPIEHLTRHGHQISYEEAIFGCKSKNATAQEVKKSI